MHEAPQTRPSLLFRLRDAADARAWTEFVAIYQPLIYRLVRQRGIQDADAGELTQDVLLAVAKAIERWDPDPVRGSFRNWLFRIARNLTINYLIRQRRHPRGSGDSDVQRLLEEQPAPDSEESALFDHEYKRRLFRWAAKAIRDEFRETTWLAFWRTSVEGRDITPVAAELGMTTGAVYIARSRIMARLRQKVEQADGEYP